MNKYSENEDLSSWWLRVIILSLASLLCTASPGNAVAAPSSEVWVSGIEAPSTVYQGSSFTLSLSFKTTSPLTEECSFFIHLVGDGPGAYLNADINLPLPVKYWPTYTQIDVGPIIIHIPPDLPVGTYRIEAGLFYTQTSEAGTRYIKIPYANPPREYWHLANIAVLPLTPTSLSTPERAGGYAVKACSNLIKLPRTLSRLTVPAQAFSDLLTLEAARNEYESCQLVVMATQESLQEVKIDLEPLIHESGHGRLDPPEVLRVEYVKTQKPYYNTPWVGEWPDPLVNCTPFDVPKGQLQPLWIRLKVPAQAQAGLYKANITIQPKGRPAQKIPVQLTVWDFTLPEETHLKTAFDLYEWLLRRYWPKKESEPEPLYQLRLQRLKDACYLDMLAHRLWPIHNVGNPSLVGKTEKGYQLDFTGFDHNVKFYLKHGQGGFGIGVEWPPGWQGEWCDQWYGLASKEAVTGVFRAYGQHLEEQGWLTKAYAYIFDETLNRVNEVTGLIHQGHPGVRNLVTYPPQPDYPDVDIWCVRINQTLLPEVTQAEGQGRELWMYVSSCMRPFPSLNLDLPAMEARITPWICWKFRFKGLLYWCVNWWEKNNPWQNPMTFGEQNGNGCLYYPNPEGQAPIASLRLELLREGMEDYEYLWLLQEALRQAKSASLIVDKEFLANTEELLKIPKDIVSLPCYYTQEPNKLYGLRAELAHSIVRLQGLLKNIAGDKKE